MVAMPAHRTLDSRRASHQRNQPNIGPVDANRHRYFEPFQLTMLPNQS